VFESVEGVDWLQERFGRSFVDTEAFFDWFPGSAAISSGSQVDMRQTDEMIEDTTLIGGPNNVDVMSFYCM
jgi:hypothetical protein